MKKTDFSRHSIADLRHWKKSNQLEIQPDYQRRSVWNPQAQIMLIDSILKGIPIPKIFIASSIKNGNTHKRIIDGQQRTTAILDFLGNKFALLSPYEGDEYGKKFKDLDEPIQNSILSYRLDFNEFENFSEEEIREIYNRVNKYMVAMNKQELRRADFPGAFLKASEQLSNDAFLDSAKIFTPANRRRMLDVEYTSELLAILIDGPQDKKATLDSYYMNYSDWIEKDLAVTTKNFNCVISDLSKIFHDTDFPISKTRFRQKSDFYSLFAAIYTFKKNGFELDEELMHSLREDLRFLSAFIEPSAPGSLGEYAIRCVSDANSKSSRLWRRDFLVKFLMGIYEPDNETPERLRFFKDISQSLDSGMCGGREDQCPVCLKELNEYDKDVVGCYPKKTIFMSSEELLHSDCMKDNQQHWVPADVE